MLFKIYLMLLLKICAYGTRANQIEDCMTNYAPCACEKQQSDFLVEQLSDNTENEYKQILSNVLSLDAGKVKNIYGRVFETGSSSVINCSNRAIRTIPKFKTLGYTNQATIDCLDLSHNKIEIISESVFYGLIFRCIDFSFNKINKVSRNAFSGLLNSLYVLKFNRNELTSSSLPAYFISKLSQLSVLSLAYNKIDRIQERSFQTVFEPNLKVLDLSYNLISCVHEEALVGVGSLTHLNLCSNKLDTKLEKNCSSAATKLGFLKNAPLLESLELCSNNIEYLTGGIDNFKHTPNLKLLNMSNNRIKTLNRMLCSPTETERSSNSYLKSLHKLVISRNSLVRIEASDFSCLVSLTDLDLEYNKLELISLNSFRNLRKLKSLKLAHNPRLLPQPALFLGLHGSLVHLSINFNTDRKTTEPVRFNYALEAIVHDFKLELLEYLDLNGSRFDKITLNLAYLFMRKNNRLKVIRCANCDFKEFELEYEWRRKLDDGGLALAGTSTSVTSDANTFESFGDGFKKHVCPREVLTSNIDNNKFITLDFKDSHAREKRVVLNSCRFGNTTLGETEDENAPLNLTCNKKNYFINKLIKYLHLSNLYCVDKAAEVAGRNDDKLVELHKYEAEKYYGLSRYYETVCNQRTPASVDCARYFQIRKTYGDEQAVAKLNASKFFNNKSSSRKLVSTYFFHFKLLFLCYCFNTVF